MNTENFERWLTELRTGERLQVTGKLARQDDSGEVGYCCLGVGAELAGVPKELANYVGAPEDYYRFGDDGDTDLAPPEFVTWLGLPEPEHSVDLQIDWPQEYGAYRVQGKRDETQYPLDLRRAIENLMTCAGLNDEGFTFEQIADVMAYFGIRGVA